MEHSQFYLQRAYLTPKLLVLHCKLLFDRSQARRLLFSIKSGIPLVGDFPFQLLAFQLKLSVHLFNLLSILCLYFHCLLVLLVFVQDDPHRKSLSGGYFFQQTLHSLHMLCFSFIGNLHVRIEIIFFWELELGLSSRCVS